MAERRYDERELTEILRTASELQASDPEAPGEGAGLTLPEIQRIANEVGIDPAHVAVAASRVGIEVEQARRFRTGGAAKRMVRERVVGGLMDESAWEDVVAELRSAFQTTGATSAVGASREWAGGSDMAAIHVSATPRNGQTRIRIAFNQTDGIVVAWLLAGVATFLSALALGIWLGSGGRNTASFALLWIAVVIGIIFGTTNRILAAWHARNSKAVDKTLERIEAVVSGRGRPQPETVSEQSPEAEDRAHIRQ